MGKWHIFGTRVEDSMKTTFDLCERGWSRLGSNQRPSACEAEAMSEARP